MALRVKALLARHLQPVRLVLVATLTAATHLQAAQAAQVLADLAAQAVSLSVATAVLAE